MCSSPLRFAFFHFYFFSVTLSIGNKCSAVFIVFEINVHERNDKHKTTELRSRWVDCYRKIRGIRRRCKWRRSGKKALTRGNYGRKKIFCPTISFHGVQRTYGLTNSKGQPANRFGLKNFARSECVMHLRASRFTQFHLVTSMLVHFPFSLNSKTINTTNFEYEVWIKKILALKLKSIPNVFSISSGM